MRKVPFNEKSPRNVIQISKITLDYDASSTKYIINQQTGSEKTTSTQPHIVRKSNRYELLRKQHKNYRQIHLAEFLNKLVSRRKSYAFQMLKLLFLFPDDSYSENISVNSYDRLFFHDEHIHTIVKIYETKEMEAKIWAFINLKNLHKRKKLQKFTEKVQTIQNKLVYRTKKSIFQKIHSYSISIKPEPAKIIPQPIKPSNQPIITVQKPEPIKPIVTRTIPTQARTNQFYKTERIETNKIFNKTITTNIQTNINQKVNINTIKPANEVIRAGQSSSIIKRIQVTPGNGMNIIYPSRMIGRSQRNNQSRSLPHRIVGHDQYFSRDVNNQSRIRIEQSKNIETPRSTIYSTDTVKKIQTTRTSPYQVRPATIATSVNYEVRQPSISRSSFNDYGYLVHTVQGNCTINIYNGNDYQQRHRIRSVSRSRDIRYHSYIQPAMEYSFIQKSQPHIQHCQCCSFYREGTTACNSTSRHATLQKSVNNINNSNNRSDLDSKIQYLKSLEQINSRITSHKNFRKD